MTNSEIVDLTNTKQLLSLTIGNRIRKNKLYALIVGSKVQGSEYWNGETYRIGNTPQQGINWIGSKPDILAVIIKTVPGRYTNDGQRSGNGFIYSLKARNGVVNCNEIANEVLIEQPKKGYPILSFEQDGDYWRFNGSFKVDSIHDNYVVISYT